MYNIKETYKKLKDTYSKENFFVSYAVNGPIIDKSEGLRAGLPTDFPLKNSPVKEPSPLNNRWIYNKPEMNISGIL